jgi:hypothetical protein
LAASVDAWATGVLMPQQLGAWFLPAKSFGGNAAAQGPVTARRAVPVEVATAVRKETPVLIEALGTVTVMASVAVKTSAIDRRCARGDPRTKSRSVT